MIVPKEKGSNKRTDSTNESQNNMDNKQRNAVVNKIFVKNKIYRFLFDKI